MASVCCFLEYSDGVGREKLVPRIATDEGYARHLAREEVTIRDATKRGEYEQDCGEDGHKEEADLKQSQDEYQRSSPPPCYTHLFPRDFLSPDGYKYCDGDKDLLRGISLGFGKPTVSPVRGHYFGPIPNFASRPNTLIIPNVIPLPYGSNTPAFHLKAPNWDSLLKFLTRLRWTRLEPELEALACVEHQLRLRIVVVFAKVPQTPQTPFVDNFDVILFITLDIPFPQKARKRYQNPNSRVLPFSYSEFPAPEFLRDEADAPTVKWFTIQETLKIGFPISVSFPDLASFLIASVERSRKSHTKDGRRLANIIDRCYPEGKLTLRQSRASTGFLERLGKRIG